ncbi:hypothetical protein SRHO_G00004980 [Serrasalmus rhombeus]
MEESRGGDTPNGPDADSHRESQPSRPEPREKWANKTEFLLSMAGEIIGLGNMWRFPYLCYKNGGGVFFIPYFVFLIFCGIPIFFLETALGQYTSEGGITAWRKICPMFEGVGVASQVIVIYLNIYYIVILAWDVFYFFNCFRSSLPWTTCDHVWNTDNCHTFNRSLLSSGLHRSDSDWSFLYNVTDSYGSDIYSNSSFSEMLPYEVVSPEEEFWLNRVLRVTNDGSLGLPHYDLTGCLLLVWTICYFCIWKGVKVTGKVVYFTAVFPYLMLLILFFRGVTLPGAGQGIIYYLYPDISKLAHPGQLQLRCRAYFSSTHMETTGLHIRVVLTFSNMENPHNILFVTVLDGEVFISMPRCGMIFLSVVQLIPPFTLGPAGVHDSCAAHPHSNALYSCFCPDISQKGPGQISPSPDLQQASPHKPRLTLCNVVIIKRQRVLHRGGDKGREAEKASQRTLMKCEKEDRAR